jgi:hypothetical protein
VLLHSLGPPCLTSCCGAPQSERLQTGVGSGTAPRCLRSTPRGPQRQAPGGGKGHAIFKASPLSALLSVRIGLARAAASLWLLSISISFGRVLHCLSYGGAAGAPCAECPDDRGGA